MVRDNRQMTGSDLVERHEQGVAYVTLARPERRNALSLALMRGLTATLEALPDTTRAVVIAGDGPAFSAGHDLTELLGRDEAFYREVFDTCTRMMETIQAIPQPVIARVHGPAYAAGCQLVAACDLAVAADTATFATPGVKIGLFCSTPMVPVSRAIGRKRALELLLTGAPITAATAAEWGLVNRAVPPEELDAAVAELVDAILAASGLVTGLGKRTFYEQVALDDKGAYALTTDVMTENAQLADAQEGMGAFVEKRRPAWTNS
jgi:enoyl-CoA hydratase/carnithine racemase